MKNSRRKLYRKEDFKRYQAELKPKSPGRSEVDRDFGRVIHCPSFRRLQGKTQLFPSHESDFFRNRLTHSLEVAQIAESIARNLNASEPYLQKNNIDPRICFTAALLHDIGHPPFGHNGEDALDEMMAAHGGFEGNAQTLRIVSQLEKKVIKTDCDNAITRRCGLNLTYRQLASIIKYDNPIPATREERKGTVKGYYLEDKPVVDDIKFALTGAKNFSGKFKSIECSIMDLADDIAYSTYDLEDSFKAGFLTPEKVLMTPVEVFERVAQKVAKETGEPFEDVEAFDVFLDMFSSHINKDHYEEVGGIIDFSWQMRLANAVFTTSEINVIAEDSRMRSEFTSSLVGQFIDSVEFNLNHENPALSSVSVPTKVKQKIETLKRFSYEATIRSSRLRLAEHRGRQIVKELFEALATDGGHCLLPDDQLDLWNSAKDLQSRMRVICDFIAGMTDRYALEFHDRLYSNNPVSMFKNA